jgi:hypothetical protein
MLLLFVTGEHTQSFEGIQNLKLILIPNPH